ncbi:hypothetical protein [Brumicola pallidula]|uniref:Uncharacterized protein n=1 Tax=Brumicola pallidula DSM 14239 = ACAM 615 TaxID=1121922 RepID=K7A1N1_9ALTE|nr:hypothetical protein [Glaciecola pallidula]GAC29420.1 conserved hypothetical protein [Glaciecola pallidula DSM 14239 = ACAM 615]
MKKLLNLAFITVLSTAAATQSVANTISTEGQLRLSYSDGRKATTGVDKVNSVLKSAGIRVSTLLLPEEVTPILEASETRSITEAESKKLISLFSLHRGQLLEQIEKAGRKPEAHRGGFLSISEIGLAPYPKVYDMKAMTPEIMSFLQDKFGKLHVNSSEDGVGIDEVMTIVSGGPWTWFFLLPDDVIGKLTLGHVGIGGQAWRISYPGLVPHGGYMDSEYGLIVAHAHGPKNFVMRYEEQSVEGAKLLGTNSWIDFTGKAPKLLD